MGLTSERGCILDWLRVIGMARGLTDRRRDSLGVRGRVEIEVVGLYDLGVVSFETKALGLDEWSES